METPPAQNVVDAQAQGAVASSEPGVNINLTPSTDQMRALIAKLQTEAAEKDRIIQGQRAAILKSQTPNAKTAYEKEMLGEERAENNAKVLTGAMDPKPGPTQFDAFINLYDESDRADNWFRVITGRDYAWTEEPLAAFRKAALLCKRFKLNLGSKLKSAGKDRPKDVRGALLRKLSEYVTVSSGEMLTKEGEYAYQTLVDVFGAEQVGGLAPVKPSADSAKPVWLHPGYGRTDNEAFDELWTTILNSNPNALFRRPSGSLCEMVKVRGVYRLEDLTPVDFSGMLAKYVVPTVITKHGDTVKYSLSEKAAKQIMSKTNTTQIPEISVMVKLPPLVKRDDGNAERLPFGYDERTGIFVASDVDMPTLSLEDAIDLVKSLKRDFFFHTAADASRHLAGFFGPALFMGGFVEGGRQIDVCEALESQTGKDYRVKLIAATYHEKMSVVVRGRAGVGRGIDEAFDAAVANARPLLLIDNLRGALDSEKIEAFVTLDELYRVRIPYKSLEVDPRRYLIYVTSNEAEFTNDISERMLTTRLTKAPEGYKFWVSSDGLPLLAHVKRNYAAYMAAIQTVVKDWWDNHYLSGSGRTQETRHSFREIVQVLDFIVQHYFGLPPLLQGHDAIKRRISDTFMSWLRRVCIEAMKADWLERDLRAHQIAKLCDSKNIPIPGVKLETDSEVKFRRIGAIMASIFGDESEPDDDLFGEEDDEPILDRESEAHACAREHGFEVEGFIIHRRLSFNRKRRKNDHLYRISPGAPDSKAQIVEQQRAPTRQ